MLIDFQLLERSRHKSASGAFPLRKTAQPHFEDTNLLFNE